MVPRSKRCSNGLAQIIGQIEALASGNANRASATLRKNVASRRHIYNNQSAVRPLAQHFRAGFSRGVCGRRFRSTKHGAMLTNTLSWFKTLNIRAERDKRKIQLKIPILRPRLKDAAPGKPTRSARIAPASISTPSSTALPAGMLDWRPAAGGIFGPVHYTLRKRRRSLPGPR